jgi:DNA-binding transcriptional LysR family regulator
MDVKWLEDFVALADTRSFSRAAELRHITQPAFSRRIQALEAWLGTDLIDRAVYPTRLTAAGETFRPQAIDMLARLDETRAMLRGQRPDAHDVVDLAMPHTLSLTFFPAWLNDVERGLGPIPTRLMAVNVHDAVLQLVQGGCDLTLVYHHPRHPVKLDSRHYDMLKLGTETVYPYCRPDSGGAPEFGLPGDPATATPFLAYTPNAYLGRIANLILQAAHPRPMLAQRFEADMAEGLKAMALAGHGVAFLPESAVRREVDAGLLVCAGDSYTETMDIRVYRARPGPDAPAKPVVDALWRHLEEAGANKVFPGGL